jgi:4-amino-4-deoxy-L-arabinose transferase-like glycosyltransferase
VFFSRLTTIQSLFILIGVSLVVKIMIALMVPITGDEAYFIVWGKHPDYGYYDHPPMVGWWLTALLQFGDHPLWLRSPTIIMTTLIGLAIYYLVRPYGRSNAIIAAGLYWLAPVNLVAPAITTDTPLIFWSFLSAVSFYRAQRHDVFAWYLLSGVFLGLAFFSKFFAGLLGIAYVLYVLLFVRRGIRPYAGLLLVLLGTLPFIYLNLLWNYQHCWNNYLFNLQNRTTDFSFSVWSMVKYLLLLLYLVTPPVAYYLWRRPQKVKEVLVNGGMGLFLALFLIPIALFLLLSTGKSVGLHWLFSFYPFLFVALPLLLHFGQLRVCFYFMWGFGLLHVVTVIILLYMLPGLFKDDEVTYKELIYALNTHELLDRVNAIRLQTPLATPSYSESALLSYYTREHVAVVGIGSHHGRQDDLLTNMNKLNGGSLAIISFSNEDVSQYAKYFNEFAKFSLPVQGVNFYLGLGTGFNSDLYNRDVVSLIKERYYKIPEWLPVGECYMHDR